MSKRIALIAVALLFTACASPNYRMNFLPTSAGGEPVAAGGGPDHPAEYSMDFEGSGCLDTDGDTCSEGTFDPDCSSGDCPISGTYSAYQNAGWPELSATSKWTETGSGDHPYFDFLFKWTGGSSSTTRWIFEVTDDGVFTRPALWFQASTGTLKISCDTGSQIAAGTTITEDVVYKFRVDYIHATDVGRLRVDDSGSDWGDGDDVDVSCDGDSTDNPSDGVFWKQQGPAGQVEYVIDDFEACTDDGGPVAGTKCNE